MNKTTKAILFISGGVILLGGALALLLKKPNTPEDDNSQNGQNNTPSKPTPQGAVTTLNTILRNANGGSLIKNKNIFARVANAKGRTQPFVNSGVISNENFIKYSTNGAIGTATGIVKDDESGTKSSQGYLLKWVEISIGKDAADEYNRNSPWYFTNVKAGQKTLFREDVIQL
jgi:hypothetical protein